MTRRAGMFALFAALFFTMSSAVKARGSGNAAPALSLKDCLDIALRESEMIKIASEAVIAASGLKRQARGAFMPDIRLQGVYTKLPEVPSILGFEMAVRIIIQGN